MAGERVTRISPTTWEIVTETATDYVGFCTIHHTVTSDPVVHLRDVQPCSLCREEARAQRHRDGYVRLLLAEKLGAALLLLLCATTATASEGYMLPIHTAPAVTMQPPVREAKGATRWVFWSALVAQGATCATQEYAFAKFGVYGAHVGTRVRSCALNLAPVLAIGAFGRWMRRADADVSIAPSIGWGVWGTVQNVRDIRKIDALLKGAK